MAKHPKNLAGIQFGDLTAVEEVFKVPNGNAVTWMWRCVCKCGNEVLVKRGNLTSGNSKCCGCKPHIRHPKIKSGDTFGRLTVVEDTGRRSRQGYVIWRCICTCGNEKEVQTDPLIKGTTVSCGCYQKEVCGVHSGKDSPNWHGGISFAPYCEKWTHTLREKIRDEFGRQCAYCGLPESENIDKNGKLHKLSVHHLDRDKEQGCNGKRWYLIPLCLHCHAKSHKIQEEL